MDNFFITVEYDADKQELIITPENGTGVTTPCIDNSVTAALAFRNYVDVYGGKGNSNPKKKQTKEERLSTLTEAINEFSPDFMKDGRPQQ